jgi:hypothetical protein
MDDPTIFRKVIDWHEQELRREKLLAEAKRRSSWRDSSKQIALTLVLTALFGGISFVLITSTMNAVVSTILIFFATAIAAHNRD